MKALPAILVDDEQHCRDALTVLLQDFCEGVDLLGAASNVEEAYALIQTHQPQLVFLDVEMPHGNGFTLLDQFDEITFEIIFTTAFDQYALQAFQVSAVDYLLKPISIKALRQAIQKVQKIQSNPPNTEKYHALKHNLKQAQNPKVALPTRDGYVFIKIHEIIRLEADKNYTNFYLKSGRKMLVSRSLGELEALFPSQFFRIHRSHLINLSYVQEYTRGKAAQIMMEDHSHLPVSRLKKDELTQALGIS